MVTTTMLRTNNDTCNPVRLSLLTVTVVLGMALDVCVPVTVVGVTVADVLVTVVAVRVTVVLVNDSDPVAVVRVSVVVSLVAVTVADILVVVWLDCVACGAVVVRVDGPCPARDACSVEPRPRCVVRSIGTPPRRHLPPLGMTVAVVDLVAASTHAPELI
jgi:hypothetical protein